MPTHYQGEQIEVASLDAFVKLMRASYSVFVSSSRSVREHGLTEPQFAILEMLFHLGPLSQNEIARKQLRTGGNTTFLIDKLETAGYVERGDKDGDRRCNVIKLTRSGTALMKRIFPGHVKMMVGIFSALSLTELKELSRLCKKLGTSIS